MIDIISYGGNIGSICRAFERLDAPYRLVARGDELRDTHAIVLPGVGQFGMAMQRLHELETVSALIERVRAGTHFLGVCVGMQILFDESEESPGVRGLSIIPGKVVRFQTAKVPQIGWNRVTSPDDGTTGHAYFVNSYHAIPDDPSVVLYSADYDGEFCAAVRKDNVTAFQFHPEKSLQFGQGLLRRWIDAL